MSEINVGYISEALNDKSDRDLMNVDNTAGADAVIAYQLPTAQNNYPWYRKYKSGWVEQGGVVTTNAIVYLPITMSDTNYTITTGNNHYSDGAGTPVVVYYNKQVGLFEIQGRWNGGSVSGLSANWAVFGMAAI